MRMMVDDLLQLLTDPPKKGLFDSSAESSMNRLLGYVNGTQKLDNTSVKTVAPVKPKTYDDFNLQAYKYLNSKGENRTDWSRENDVRYNAKVDNELKARSDNQVLAQLGELALRVTSDPVDMLLSSLEYAKGDINGGEFALSLLPIVSGGLFKAGKSLSKIDDVIDTSKPTLKPLEEYKGLFKNEEPKELPYSMPSSVWNYTDDYPISIEKYEDLYGYPRKTPADELILMMETSRAENRQFTFEDLHNYVTQHDISRDQIPTGYWSNKIDELIMDNPFSTSPFEVVEYLRGNKDVIRNFTINDSPKGFNAANYVGRNVETGDYFTDLENARINRRTSFDDMIDSLTEQPIRTLNSLPRSLLGTESLEALNDFSQTYTNLFNQHLINKGINDYSIQAKFNGSGLGVKTLNKDGGVIGGWNMGLNNKAIEKIISRDSSVPEFPRDSSDPYYEIPVMTMQNTTNVGLPPNSGVYGQDWWDYFRDQTGVRHGAGKNSQTTNDRYIQQGKPELKGSHDIWKKKVEEGKAWNSRRGNDMNRYVDAISYGILGPLLYKLFYGEIYEKEEKR